MEGNPAIPPASNEIDFTFFIAIRSLFQLNVPHPIAPSQTILETGGSLKIGYLILMEIIRCTIHPYVQMTSANLFLAYDSAPFKISDARLNS